MSTPNTVIDLDLNELPLETEHNPLAIVDLEEDVEEEDFEFEDSEREDEDELVEFDDDVEMDKLVSSVENEDARREMLLPTADYCLNMYRRYAHKKGFSVRIKYERKRIITYPNGHKEEKKWYLQYVCNKQGFGENSTEDPKKKRKRPEDHIRAKPIPKRKKKGERVGCKARIIFNWDMHRNGYFVKEFSANHINHRLHIEEHSFFHRSNRQVTKAQGIVAESNEDAGLRLSSSYEVLKLCSGGEENLGFTLSDHKNHLSKRRQKLMGRGEATFLYEYFREQQYLNPGFYYDVEVDNEENVANIFWSDARMQADFKLFGDSISFDTTYRTNKAYRPLGMFVGFNHHRQACIFGACLLFDETIPSFQWLFNSFRRCMKGEVPATMFTDQDPAMAVAMQTTLPDTFHALCTWHILMNAKKNLQKGFTQEFQNHLMYLFYDVDNETEFDIAWKAMIDECFPNSDVENGKPWLHYIKKFRKKWCACWVKQNFTAGMLTTQVSESCNAAVRLFLKRDHSLLQFFTHFRRLVNKKRSNERVKDFEATDRFRYNNFTHSAIVTKAAEMLTPNMFVRFEAEFAQTFQYEIRSLVRTEDDGLIGFDTFIEDGGDRRDERTVLVNIGKTTLECECRLFNTFGILCRHILKVMDHLGSFGNMKMRTLPDDYIKPRWMKKEHREKVSQIPEPPQPQVGPQGIRYMTQSARLNKLTTKVCMQPDNVYKKCEAAIDRLCNKIEKAIAIAESKNSPQPDIPQTGEGGTARGNHFKPRPKPDHVGEGRWKSTGEKKRQKKKISYRKKQRMMLSQESVESEDVDPSSLMVEGDDSIIDFTLGRFSNTQ